MKIKEHTRDKEKLQRLENFYTTARIYELVKNPIIGFEVKDLKKFTDIFFRIFIILLGNLEWKI